MGWGIRPRIATGPGSRRQHRLLLTQRTGSGFAGWAGSIDDEVVRRSHVDQYRQLAVGPRLATLLAMGTDCCVATYDLSDDELAAAMGAADAIVDAIVGYNLSGPPRDDVARLIGYVIEAHRPVISLDLPSGLDPDSGLVSGIAVTAAATMTLALPKPGLFTHEGPRHSGRLYLADIGLPPGLYHGLGLDVGSLFAAGRIVRVHQDR